jgi:hypothetical protein
VGVFGHADLVMAGRRRGGYRASRLLELFDRLPDRWRVQ